MNNRQAFESNTRCAANIYIIRTNTMVDDPVTAKTVQIKTISRYQAKVWRGGISLGSMNRCKNVLLLQLLLDDDDNTDASSFAEFVASVGCFFFGTTRITFSTPPIILVILDDDDDDDEFLLVGEEGEDEVNLVWQILLSRCDCLHLSGPVKSRNPLLLVAVVLVQGKKLAMVYVWPNQMLENEVADVTFDTLPVDEWTTTSKFKLQKTFLPLFSNSTHCLLTFSFAPHAHNSRWHGETVEQAASELPFEYENRDTRPLALPIYSIRGASMCSVGIYKTSG